MHLRYAQNEGCGNNVRGPLAGEGEGEGGITPRADSQSPYEWSDGVEERGLHQDEARVWEQEGCFQR